MAFSICYWANYIQGKKKLSRKSVNAVADARILNNNNNNNSICSAMKSEDTEAQRYIRRPTSCWILSAMSPEIQEWSHKSRSRINNLYLLTRLIWIVHVDESRRWTVGAVTAM